MSELTDEEWLLRSFPVPDSRSGKPEFHFHTVDGKLHFSQAAFNDKAQEPSVYRLNKLDSIEQAKFAPTDGVVKLSSIDIIGLSNDRRRHFGFADPTEYQNGHAHAKIMSTPKIENRGNAEKRYWKVFKEQLALLATKHGWACPPQ